MTIAQSTGLSTTQALSQPSKGSGWTQADETGEPRQTRCGYIRSYIRGGKAYRQRVTCGCISCPRCGPKKLARDLSQMEDQVARARHDGRRLWVGLTEGGKAACDSFRKKAKRAVADYCSVPIQGTEGAEVRVTIASQPFGPEWCELTDDMLGRIFLQLRIAKKNISRGGRWSQRGQKDSAPPQPEVKLEGVDHVSLEAWVVVAQNNHTTLASQDSIEAIFNIPTKWGTDPLQQKKQMEEALHEAELWVRANSQSVKRAA